eukprot:TRINITY_DN35496_c0_g1_i1.p1 TRINITY_DN35496_c0_g1~~TRINITY_DN35496_c0_g1_i1.p1  ORF type:complete len:563 (+),score=34.46 TRINITY_DN35496_c0_g1_i1:172-1689(+)
MLTAKSVCGRVGVTSAHGCSSPGETVQVWSGTTKISSDVTVLPGESLVIRAGALVQLGPRVKIRVRGNLSILGTAENPVTLTGSSGQWGGISVETGNYEAVASIAFAILEHASSALYTGCCHKGDVRVVNTTFRMNSVAMSGYTGYKVPVHGCLFYKNTQGITSADKDVRWSNFSRNGCGLCSVERVDVRNTMFEHNDVGACGGRGTFDCNVLRNNTIGVRAFYEGWPLRSNTFEYNSEVAVITGSYDSRAPAITNNNFVGNGLGARHLAPVDVDMGHNWWGTTNGSLVDAMFTDFFSDASRGMVLIFPIREGPVVMSQCSVRASMEPNVVVTDRQAHEARFSNVSYAMYTNLSSGQQKHVLEQASLDLAKEYKGSPRAKSGVDVTGARPGSLILQYEILYAQGEAQLKPPGPGNSFEFMQSAFETSGVSMNSSFIPEFSVINGGNGHCAECVSTSVQRPAPTTLTVSSALRQRTSDLASVARGMLPLASVTLLTVYLPCRGLPS